MKKLIVLLILSLAAFTTAALAQKQQHTRDFTLLETYTLPDAAGWDYMTIDPVSRYLYLTLSSHITVLNADTGDVAGEIADTPGVHGVSLAKDLNRGFASLGKDNSVQVFNLNTFAKENKIQVGTKPDAILYEPISRSVWAFNAGSNNVTFIDANTLQVLRTIALPGNPEFAVTNGKYVFVNIEDKGLLIKVGVESGKIEASWPLSPCEAPSGLAIDPHSSSLFSVCENNLMVETNASSGKIESTIPIGSGPDAAVYDPTSDIVLSSNGKDGTVTIVSKDSKGTFSVFHSVATSKGARTMALDAGNNRLYLISAKNISANLEARPKTYEAGSTKVQVFQIK